MRALVRRAMNPDQPWYLVHKVRTPLQPSFANWKISVLTERKPTPLVTALSGWADRLLYTSGKNHLLVFEVRGRVAVSGKLTVDPPKWNDDVGLSLVNITGTTTKFQRTWWAFDPLTNPFPEGKVRFVASITSHAGFVMVKRGKRGEPDERLHTPGRVDNYTTLMSQTDSVRTIFRRLKSGFGSPTFPRGIEVDSVRHHRFSFAWLMLALDWYVNVTTEPFNLFPTAPVSNEDREKATRQMSVLKEALTHTNWPLPRLCKYGDFVLADLIFFLRLEICTEERVRQKIEALTYLPWDEFFFDQTSTHPAEPENTHFLEDSSLTDLSLELLIANEDTMHLDEVKRDPRRLVQICESHHLLVVGSMDEVMQEKWEYRNPRYNEKETGRTSTLQMLTHYKGDDRRTLKQIGYKRIVEGLEKPEAKEILASGEVLTKEDVINLYHAILYKRESPDEANLFPSYAYTEAYKRNSIYRPTSDVVSVLDYDVYLGKDLVIDVAPKSLSSIYAVYPVFCPLASFHSPLIGDGQTATLNLIQDDTKRSYGKEPVVRSLRKQNDPKNAYVPAVRGDFSMEYKERDDVEKIEVLCLSSLISNQPSLGVAGHFFSRPAEGELAPRHASTMISIDFPVIGKVSDFEAPKKFMRPEDTKTDEHIKIFKETDRVVTSRFSNTTYRQAADAMYFNMTGKKNQISKWIDDDSLTEDQKPMLITACPISISDDGAFNVPRYMVSAAWDDPICKDNLFVGQSSVDQKKLRSNVILLQGGHGLFVVILRTPLETNRFLEDPEKQGWSMYKNPFFYGK